MEAIIAIAAALVVLGGAVWFWQRRNARPPTPLMARQELRPPEPEGPEDGWLVGTGGDVLGKTFRVGFRTFTIGREGTNYIQVVDGEVSRKHCQVTQREGYLQIVDMKSENGTFINGEPIANGRLLPGDQLRLGAARLVYETHIDHVQDDARTRKKSGKATLDTTVGARGPNLLRIVKTELDASGWDVDGTARKLGVEPEMLRDFMNENGLRPPGA